MPLTLVTFLIFLFLIFFYFFDSDRNDPSEVEGAIQQFGLMYCHTEGLFVAYTDSGEAHFVPTTKFLSLPTLMRLDILKDWIMGLMNYYSLVGEDWLEEIEEEQNE